MRHHTAAPCQERKQDPSSHLFEIVDLTSTGTYGSEDLLSPGINMLSLRAKRKQHEVSFEFVDLACFVLQFFRQVLRSSEMVF